MGNNQECLEFDSIVDAENRDEPTVGQEVPLPPPPQKKN